MNQPLPRPAGLFDRAADWDELAAFAAPGGLDSLRLGVVYGRRRQGKSEILHQLCDATEGLYTLALEQHSKPLALPRTGYLQPQRLHRRAAPGAGGRRSHPGHAGRHVPPRRLNGARIPAADLASRASSPIEASGVHQQDLLAPGKITKFAFKTDTAVTGQPLQTSRGRTSRPGR